jgi:glycosidase
LGKRDGEEVECDFFSLRDLWTAPGSAHFDRLVDEFVEIHAFYMLEIGVDGLRIDTIKHVHHEFWDAFTARLRQRLGEKAKDKILFGEVYDGDPAVLGRYTWRADKESAPCLDSVLDFRFCFAARDYLRHGGNRSGSPEQLEKALSERAAQGPGGRPYYNPHPGPDGLNSRDKAITFIENHDGLNRFLVDGVTARRNLLAQALVLTSPGIPCLYYGTEVSLHDTAGKVGQDGETGRMTCFRREGGPVMREAPDDPAFRGVAALTRLRRELPALRGPVHQPLWCDSPAGGDDDGVFAFARAGGEPLQTVVVAFNASEQPRVTAAGGHRMRLRGADGKLLFPAGAGLRVLRPLAGGAEPAALVMPEDGVLSLAVPPGEVVVLTAGG